MIPCPISAEMLENRSSTIPSAASPVYTSSSAHVPSSVMLKARTSGQSARASTSDRSTPSRESSSMNVFSWQTVRRPEPCSSPRFSSRARRICGRGMRPTSAAMGREKKMTAWKNWIWVSMNCSRVIEPSRRAWKYGLSSGVALSLIAAMALRILQISEVAR